MTCGVIVPVEQKYYEGMTERKFEHIEDAITFWRAQARAVYTGKVPPQPMVLTGRVGGPATVKVGR